MFGIRTGGQEGENHAVCHGYWQWNGYSNGRSERCGSHLLLQCHFDWPSFLVPLALLESMRIVDALHAVESFSLFYCLCLLIRISNRI